MSARGGRLRVVGWVLVVLLLASSAGSVVHGSTLAYGEPPAAESEVGALPAPDDSRDRGAYAWRTAHVDALFPDRVEGSQLDTMYYTAPVWHRVGVAEPAACGKALDRRTRRRLREVGCRVVLRATYVDSTWTHVATLAVIAVDDAGALPDGGIRDGVWGGNAAHGVLPASFAGTPAAGFHARKRFATRISTGSTAPADAVGVGSGWLAAVSLGFADGRTTAGRAEVVGRRDRFTRGSEALLGTFAATVRRS